MNMSIMMSMMMIMIMMMVMMMIMMMVMMIFNDTDVYYLLHALRSYYREVC